MGSYYESEFEENLINLFEKNYSIKKDTYKYLILRYMFSFEIPFFETISFDSLGDFLLAENNLRYPLVYKKDYIDKSIIGNIAKNILFEILKEDSQKLSIDFINNTYAAIYKESLAKNSKFRKHTSYKDRVLYSSLCALNKIFDISYSSFYKMDNLDYPEDYNEFERFREEKLESYIDSYKTEDSPFLYISEKDLENFLRKNLFKIEDGLEFISAQEEIKDGVIDILAKDKSRTYVLIELKINKDDTRVIWQSLYYPEEFKKERKVSNVRMMVVSPRLNDSIYSVLKDLKNVEYFEYELILDKEKISDIIGEKII